MFFDSWGELGRILVVGVLGYAGLVALLRISGKRTLARMNAFDLVVTVAVGSTLSSLILTASVALSEGLLALALLFGLQYAIAWLSTRSPRFRALVKAEPRLLAYRGRLLRSALSDERVSGPEVLQAARAQGHARLEEVEAVVLETDGSFSVVGRSEGPAGTLEDVRGADAARPGGPSS